jgi:hypothetical protein
MWGRIREHDQRSRSRRATRRGLELPSSRGLDELFNAIIRSKEAYNSDRSLNIYLNITYNKVGFVGPTKRGRRLLDQNEVRARARTHVRQFSKRAREPISRRRKVRSHSSADFSSDAPRWQKLTWSSWCTQGLTKIALTKASQPKGARKFWFELQKAPLRARTAYWAQSLEDTTK